MSLWVSKSRLVPSKSFSIPRLELLACLLLSKLVVSVLKAVEGEVKVLHVFCWSDSQVSLWWIKQCRKRWSIWVQNRVEVIRKNTSPDIWFYVPSSENAADISTRSISLHHFTKSIWLTGPSFLSYSQDNWPSQGIMSLCSGEVNLEEKVSKTVVNVVGSECGVGQIIDCVRFGSLEKLLRVTAYVIRFVNNIRSKIAKREKLCYGDLTVEETDESLKCWIKYEQSFIVKSNKFEKTKNSLNLFYDE